MAAAAGRAQQADRWAPLLALQQALRHAPQALALLQWADCLGLVVAAVVVAGWGCLPATAGAVVQLQCPVVLQSPCSQQTGGLNNASMSRVYEYVHLHLHCVLLLRGSYH